MKLGAKLITGMTAGIMAVLLAHGVWSASRVEERALLRYEKGLTTRASMLGTFIEETWRSKGFGQARELVRRTNKTLEQERAVQLVRYDPAKVPDGLPIEPTVWRQLAAEPTAEIVQAELTYTASPVRLRGSDKTVGVLVLSEPHAGLHDRISDLVRTRILVTLLVCLVAGLMTYYLVQRVVIRPLELLGEGARRLAGGDTSAHIDHERTDEIGQLATEFNRMAAAVGEAQQRLLEEERARVSVLRELRHAERLKQLGQFVASVVHEMGTPLNVIGARSKMIARGKLKGDRLISSAKIIAQQADRMAARIRTILSYARREVGDSIPIDLAAVTREALDMLGPFLHKAGVTVSWELPESIGCLGDHAQFEQVITNLLSNAAHAMPDGGDIHVVVRTREDGKVELSVSDTGTGMTEDVRKSIFQAFFTTKGDRGGTGLGLAVSLGIIHQHGGDIDVETEVGVGTTFRIWLEPAQVPDA